LGPHVHAFETFATYFAESAVPLLFFLPHDGLRATGFWLTVGFNVAIGATGNYAFLHMLTITEAVAVLSSLSPSDSGLAPLPPLDTGSSVIAVLATIGGLAILLSYVAVSLVPLLSTAPDAVQWLKARVPHFARAWAFLSRNYEEQRESKYINYFSKFTHMTKQRVELEIEGTADKPGGARRWYVFGFRGKPGAGPATETDPRPGLRRVPPTFLPGYISLFDWRLWFLLLRIQSALERGMPISAVRANLKLRVEPWFRVFERALLEQPASSSGDTAIDAASPASLVEWPEPLKGKKLTAVRSRAYLYQFAEKQAEGEENGRDEDEDVVRPGDVWRRRFICEYDAVYAA
jgi:hypothetical protein